MHCGILHEMHGLYKLYDLLLLNMYRFRTALINACKWPLATVLWDWALTNLQAVIGPLRVPGICIDFSVFRAQSNSHGLDIRACFLSPSSIISICSLISAHFHVEFNRGLCWFKKRDHNHLFKSHLYPPVSGEKGRMAWIIGFCGHDESGYWT